ncbi:tetratricopeptide repeat protein [Amycolatopsis sp. NPDC051071]|uniref:tetratricopeptide repeat protein n=1 Tax=Amycolatopsis sp. NPDC051071 TaxID=3154637 RepID=UPI003421D375
MDVEGFGDQRRTNSHQLAVRAALYETLRQAFDEIGAPWEECDREDRGDAVFVLVPAQVPKAPFVDSLPQVLAAAVREHNRVHRSEERIRLRMALHAGEVAYDEHGVAAAAVNLTFRLLDAAPLRAALCESPGVLALITSDWFFDDVVRHCRVLDPATFRPVSVQVKETSTVGWICLPDHPYPSDPAQVTVRPVAGAGAQVPRQLPAPPRTFVGRDDELAALTALLEDRERPNGMVVIGGAGGIGKTWLALKWAHDNLHRFPEGQLFVDLRGFSPDGLPMSPAVAIRGFLDSLGLTHDRIPSDPHAQAALFRSIVADKSLLILLDNAVGTEQVIPLLPGSASCAVVVTSRSRLPGLATGHDACPLFLDVLTDHEARTLLTDRLGTTRAGAEPAVVDELVEFCRGFPLALSIVAGNAATHEGVPLACLAAELHEAGVEALDSADPAASLPAVFSWSHQALADDEAEAVVLVGLAPGPDIGLWAAASLVGTTVARARTLLRGLEEKSLVGHDGAGRYRMHDLVRRYVTETARGEAAVDGREDALRRIVDFYLHTAHAADKLLDPHREALRVTPAARGCLPLTMPDEAAALGWLDSEHTCVLAAQRLAVELGWNAAAVQFALAMHTFHWRTGRLDEQVAVGRLGLVAAERTGSTAVQALAHRALAEAHALLGRQAEALDHLQRALPLAERFGDPSGQAHVLRILAWAKSEQGEFRLALENIVRALRLFQSVEDEEWEARALNQTAWYFALLGHYEQAAPFVASALDLHRRHGNHNGEALSLTIEGFLAHQAGRHQEALRHGERALAMLRELGNIYFVAQVVDILGQVHAALEEGEDARRYWQEARDLYRVQNRVARAERIQRLLDGLGS